MHACLYIQLGFVCMQEFHPDVLTTRSRAETATMKRRLEMEKDMERHERERILTARPEDLEGEGLAEEEGPLPSPPSSVANMVCAIAICVLSNSQLLYILNSAWLSN